MFAKYFLFQTDSAFKLDRCFSEAAIQSEIVEGSGEQSQSSPNPYIVDQNFPSQIKNKRKKKSGKLQNVNSVKIRKIV